MATARVERIKRRMVQQAVKENLDMIHGRWQRPPRRRNRFPWQRAVLLLLVPFAVLASAYAINTHGPRLMPVDGGGVAVAAMPVIMAPEVTASVPAEDVELPPELLASTRPVDHQVFPLAVRRVVLDPGHGGSSLGTRTSSGLMEKEITLDIAHRLARLLTDGGLEVVLTREEDTFVPLEERARLANEGGADLFISIHVNWIEDGRRSRGVETYYLGTTDDPYLNRLAASENRDSGYSLADLRHLVDRIYTGVRTGKSQELAGEVQASLFRSLRKVNPELEDRGVKTAPFLVLVDTEMPAILAEVSCLSNQREASLLAKPLYRQYIAEALSQGIHDYATVSTAATLAAAEQGS